MGIIPHGCDAERRSGTISRGFTSQMGSFGSNHLLLASPRFWDGRGAPLQGRWWCRLDPDRGRTTGSRSEAREVGARLQASGGLTTSPWVRRPYKTERKNWGGVLKPQLAGGGFSCCSSSMAHRHCGPFGSFHCGQRRRPGADSGAVVGCQRRIPKMR